MAIIKGWKKTIDTEKKIMWVNGSSQIGFFKVGQMTTVKKNNYEYFIDGSKKGKLFSIGNSKIKSEALEMATKYMKSHPRG